ncbi:MAG TPA: hypothetical protein PKZ89_01065 [Alphaproteobacteria bacterium]|nr:hypothetical protein [Alphaproteobacteria bacterium]
MYTDQPMMKEVRVTSGLTGLELAVKQDVSNWAVSVDGDYSALNGISHGSAFDLQHNKVYFKPYGYIFLERKRNKS